MQDVGLIEWDKRRKLVLRQPGSADYFPDGETDTLTDIIERSFMRKLLLGGAEAGMQINELELAREIGVGTTSVREFLIRFSRFGLIEKRPNSHWVLKGFTRDFALELTEIREMFELRSASGVCRDRRPAARSGPNSTVSKSEHRALLARHRRPLSRIFRTGRAVPPPDPQRVAQPFHHRFLRRHRDDLPLSLPVEQGGRGASATERALEEHLAYIAALKSGDAARVDDACRRHLRSARETLLQSIPESYRD